MILEETFTLSNGVEIPEAGLRHLADPGEAAAQVVREAVEAGYRHIDTAQAYANERGVGEGLRASGVAREQLFVTTKLAAECKNYAKPRIASTARWRRSES
jgi:diketogulonate reductase-like aldo/keto reductase